MESKRLCRFGLLLGFCRSTSQRSVRLVRVLTSSVQKSLAYVWSRRRKSLSFMKTLLDFLKVVIDLIKIIRTLLFCNQTARYVRVAG